MGQKSPEGELQELFEAYEKCLTGQRSVRVATCKGVVTFEPVDHDSAIRNHLDVSAETKSRTVFVRIREK
ncbi:MAG: hypothetical protein A4E60_03365 [Syntrophorhabdus sp. PtaB.Bin047]|jgi:hypothetical protein|nr:MAG: hypothetical protein A4E60_03365 [Syntrophorhabdus sp. PtaB.Bin047]